METSQVQANRRGTFQNVTDFINHEATAGFVLAIAAIAAIIFDNTAALAPYYESLLATPIKVQIGDLLLAKPLILWVNDGLMAIFFFLVGLEIKREVLEGHLSSADQLVLPGFAAVGGMAVPAAVYMLIVSGSPDTELSRGWAIPAATDIAFALGALAVLGSRIPLTLKIFLLTLATLDDLGAIVIIALFYTGNLSVMSLVLAGGAAATLVVINLAGITRVALYVFVGACMWVFVLKSGVHATLAGVILAFAIPMKDKSGSPIVEKLEHGLHPYVVWGILPLFAFANAGVSFAGISLDALLEPLPLGIAAGLSVGKPVGIVAMALIAVGLGLAKLPEGTRWQHIIGVAFLAGIGFTMSLFVGMLAFEADEHSKAVRLGVIAGSLLSAVAGYLILRFAGPTRQN
ncbi:MAG: Na+/H+ antiporter NhaA [Hyphomicrobiales bacterium]|nr:Na+/H+ antiporter NhaA [Hyphomicrobiales bacterium]